MSDIVDRLRKIVGSKSVYDIPIIREAADEIEIRDGRIARRDAEIVQLREADEEWQIISDNYGKQVRLLNGEVARLKKALNPRTWSGDQHDAWHRALPDTQAAFDAIRGEAE